MSSPESPPIISRCATNCRARTPIRAATVSHTPIVSRYEWLVHSSALWRSMGLMTNNTPELSGNKRVQTLASTMLKLLPVAGAVLLGGCDWAILDSKGQIGMEERSVIATATWLMLIIVVPVIAMIGAFAWKYRASNTRAQYSPDWDYSHRIAAAMVLIPSAIIICLSVIAWRTSHALDPYRPLDSEAKPVTIEVVALDWKWLFIYPDQQLATVNEIAFPTDVPINFRITSGSVMNSFFIPQLGGQIYAMSGHAEQLRLIANQPGTYDGISANYSGGGFSDMKFKAIATTEAGLISGLIESKTPPDSSTLWLTQRWQSQAKRTRSSTFRSWTRSYSIKS